MNEPVSAILEDKGNRVETTTREIVLAACARRIALARRERSPTSCEFLR